MSQKEENKNRLTHGTAVWRPVVMPRLFYPVVGESIREDSVCLEL